MRMNFGRVCVHFPRINKAEVWLREIKNLSSKRESWSQREEGGGKGGWTGWKKRVEATSKRQA